MEDYGTLNNKIDVYYEPLEGAFNISPSASGVSSINDIDTEEILGKYRQRFEDAWKELAER